MPTAIAIVDDNEGLLQTLARNLSAFGEINLLFTASNGQQALDMARQTPPDVVLMDIDMPVLDGIRATALLKASLPDTKILMLTIFDRDDKLFEAIKAGASGYLLKDELPARIVTAIEEVIDGGAPMSPGIASRALAMLRNQPPLSTGKERKPTSPDSYLLTKREVEILEQLSQGLATSQIADKLFVSDRTVRKHVENIYAKLHVHSKFEAIQLAARHQWFIKTDI
jgi:DNA-binding NarL/FixJ family response regulator